MLTFKLKQIQTAVNLKRVYCIELKIMLQLYYNNFSLLTPGLKVKFGGGMEYKLFLWPVFLISPVPVVLTGK